MRAGDLTLELTALAVKHLMSIDAFGAEQWGEERANRYTRRIFTVFEHLRRHPELGVAHAEYGDGIRTFPVERHIVVYRLDDATVRILAIPSASANIQAALADDEQ